MKLVFDKVNSACVQAEFYHQCRVNNIPCYLEYIYEHSRFDVVIYNKKNRNILAIVEVKSYLRKEKKAKITTKQAYKYSKYGIPLIYVVRLEEIEWAINYIKTNILEKEYPDLSERKIISVEEPFEEYLLSLS